MTVSSCPKCYDKISVPTGADGNARVQCPLCRAEYLLGDVLDKLPPALILLDAPVATEEVAPADSFGGGFAISTDQDSEFKLADSEESGKAPAFQFEDSSASQATASPSSSPSFTATARPKRREKKAWVEIVKVVGGGMAGLFIAQLILWWLPGGWSRDPLEIAPKIGRYVPFMVPAVYRPKKTNKKVKKSDSNSSVKKKSSTGNDTLTKPDDSDPSKTTKKDGTPSIVDDEPEGKYSDCDEPK